MPNLLRICAPISPAIPGPKWPRPISLSCRGQVAFRVCQRPDFLICVDEDDTGPTGLASGQARRNRARRMILAGAWVLDRRAGCPPLKRCSAPNWQTFCARTGRRRAISRCCRRCSGRSDQSGDHIDIPRPRLMDWLSVIPKPCCRMCGHHKKPDSMSSATCAARRGQVAFRARAGQAGPVRRLCEAV